MQLSKVNKKFLIEYYGNQADDIERMYKKNIDFEQKIRLDFLKKQFLNTAIPNNPSILDIGCGDGFAFSYITNHKKFKNYIAVDFSEIKLKTLFQQNNDATVCITDADNLPFKENNFDVIFCLEVLEHVIDPDVVLNQIFKLLKDGGVCFISIPIDSYIQVRSLKMIKQYYNSDVFSEHINAFYPEELKQLLVKNNFQIISFCLCNFTFPFRKTILKYFPKNALKIERYLRCFPIALIGFPKYIDLEIGNKYCCICGYVSKKYFYT
jgi:2-polyprenyl-3-methyl-5-hydroxy-6-metoxy-1,4-benzoquinol methylase